MRSKTPPNTTPTGPRRQEPLAIAIAALTLLYVLALVTYDANGGADWVGPVGETVASLFVTGFGLGAAWFVVELAVVSATLFGLRMRTSWITQAASGLGILLLGCPLLHLLFGETTVFGGHLAGGVLGEMVAEVMRSLVGPVGAYVVCIAAVLVTAVLRTRLSVVTVSGRAGRGAAGLYRRAADGLGTLAAAWREAKSLEERELARAEALSAPRITLTGDETTANEVEDDEQEDVEDTGVRVRATTQAPSTESEEDEAAEEEEPAAARIGDRESGRPRAPRLEPSKARGRAEPVIVKPTSDAGTRKAPKLPTASTPTGEFLLPPPRLLSEVVKEALDIDEPTLRANATRLVEKLGAYGVRGRVDEIHPGPVVTMYEFEPESGTKLSKIAALADDLAMALAAEKVRIVAPIPGKARVGFELPNDRRQVVPLRDLLEHPSWREYGGTLPMALGKDIKGQPVYGDLAKMPHLLVAGATGAGKSVGLNVMLVSLLAKKTPEELRLLMIDPKVVELAVFDGIPHMLLPVVTDMKKASLALRWAVDEMERRYQLFADASARNVASYNSRVERVLRGEVTMEQFMPKRAGKVRARDEHGQEILLAPIDGEHADANDFEPQKLPHIVLVVDEFSDMMMVAAKDVEAAIARLAQKARAAGIHVILATQRPSVDVITGMIKANFPSRIAYKVAQREDSKTILGRQGAEHLLGLGDMLTLLPGASELKRVHSALITEDEVKAVCDFLRAQGDPVYDQSILAPRDDDDDLLPEPSDDPLYDRAVAVVAEAGYCSISHVQRKLGIGYNKAAELVERLEAQGVVGPPSGKAGGRREVLISAA